MNAYYSITAHIQAIKSLTYQANILTEELVPILEAPASTIDFISSLLSNPPDAFTPALAPTAYLII
ncbi:hypothetical protein CD33_13310 [Ureibacillus sinduriensis BLB-1 = JCM 15800]|uniref:Uncharacterized protein n=1 Tax=Ureibacillus sinduriensis BLB-1 = JCM 15800 TaxID=1384057 RepID=A0A0A3HQA8_9BACL|nr:hypothetical protein CD33_13310 [Ureibacillus sinduriensis BLB-1 = JCM 15800]